MKILVTGSAGFIGSNLTEFLLSKDHTVIGLDNLITGSPKNVERQSIKSNFTFFETDITKIDEGLMKTLKYYKFDEVYHLACPTGVPNLITLSEEMLLANSLGTKNILDIAKASNSRVVLFSSSEVYGDPKTFPQSESYTGNVDPTGIRSPYEEGKRFGESLISMYVRKYDLDARIVRIFNTYGPNMAQNDQRVIPKMMNQAEKGEPLSVHGDGSQRRTFCYIDDLIEGLILVMKDGKSGEVYNLGSDSEIRIEALAKLIAKLSGAEPNISYESRPNHDHQARMPDLDKIKGLGWKPKINLEEGIVLTFKHPQPAKI